MSGLLFLENGDRDLLRIGERLSLRGDLLGDIGLCGNSSGLPRGGVLERRRYGGGDLLLARCALIDVGGMYESISSLRSSLLMSLRSLRSLRRSSLTSRLSLSDHRSSDILSRSLSLGLYGPSPVCPPGL